MEHTATLHYDDRLVRAALQDYLGGYLSQGFYVSLAVVAVGLIVLAAQDAWAWYTLVLALILLLGLSIPAVLYGIMLPVLTRRFRALYGDSAEFRITDEAVEVTTAQRSGKTPWNRILRVRRQPHVWLLFTGKDSFTLMPTADLPEAVQSAIVERVQANGGLVE